MPADIWLNDFAIEDGIVHVRKTGARVPIEAGTIRETLAWLAFYISMEAKTALRARTGPKIWFGPDKPRPWYLIWAAMRSANLPVVRHCDNADFGFFFEDVTTSSPPKHTRCHIFNGQCGDVSKTRVAQVFKLVSGRDISVDPETHYEMMVEKSEHNGAHDGQLIQGPVKPKIGQVYQRLIDTQCADNYVEDLRCPTIDGEIPIVFIKRRPVDRRFENANSSVLMMDPKAVFTQAELDLVHQFCFAMGLDWGGLDILRDRNTGELWVVDVNKTDMGPPTALQLKDKLEATRTIGASLRKFVTKMAGAH